MTHDLIFDKIMMLVCMSILKSLHRCIQVYRTWIVVIMEKILENPCAQEECYQNEDRGKLPVITCTASLAHHRLLGSVKEMRLEDVDLTSVPAEHLASLVSIVSMGIGITNLIGSGLITILDNVKNERQLEIKCQGLNIEETEALARTKSRGMKILLSKDVTIDISNLSSDNVLVKRNQEGRLVKRYKRNWKATKTKDHKLCDIM